MKISESTDSVSVELEGIKYTLSRTITGGQFIELRRKSIKAVASVNGAEESKRMEVDSSEFDLWNTYYRLTDPEMTIEEFKELPRVVFQDLVLTAGKLDNLEAQSVSDFLRENSQLFQTLESILEPSLDSPPATTEASSE